MKVLTAWLKERGEARDNALLITNRCCRFSRDGVARIVKKYAQIAVISCPSIGEKRVSPYTLRHTCAMDFLRKGIDCSIIALWLGHETLETTQLYLHAEMGIKKRAMDQTKPADIPEGIYRPKDDILVFLESL